MNRICYLFLWVCVVGAPMSTYGQSVEEPENPFAADRDRAIQQIANSQVEQAELQRQQLELQRQQLEQQRQAGQQSPQTDQSAAFIPNISPPPPRDIDAENRQSIAEMNAYINATGQRDREVIESGNRINVADALGRALDADDRRKAAQAQNSVSNAPALNYDAAAAAAAAATSTATNSPSPPAVSPYATPITPDYSTQGNSNNAILYLIIGFLTLALFATFAYASRNQRSNRETD